MRMWRKGSAPPPHGPVHVSMNDYVVHRLRDVPAVWYEGLRFAAHWPRTEGALGLWIAGFGKRQTVSISVWRSADDLRRFVRSPRHRKVMKRHRHTGDLVTTAWPAARLDKQEIWEQGKARVRGQA